MNRRTFLTSTGATAVCSRALAAVDGLDHRNERADIMPYRQLGRTKFMCSRLIFGCGAALAGGRAVRLLDRAFEAGVNYYDIGSNDYYKGAENYLAPFLKAHRADVWVTSKGYARTGDELTPNQSPSLEQAKTAATFWTGLVEQSLKNLDTEYIDAYFTQGTNSTALLKSEEMGRAFEKLRAEGKIKHAGISTHENAAAVLEAAVDTGWYDLAMVAVTPGGWYDWKNKVMLEGTPPLKTIRPQLDRARDAGLGIIGMKVARFIAGAVAGGRGEPATYDPLYNAALLQSPLNSWQRAYAYVLENGVDAVNSDMQNLKHFEENLTAVRTSREYFA